VDRRLPVTIDASGEFVRVDARHAHDDEPSRLPAGCSEAAARLPGYPGNNHAGWG
jgi:hypothetical protein